METNLGKAKPTRHLPTRAEQLTSLQSESFDVLIIGGGATGAGCAVDSATRGNEPSRRHQNHYFLSLLFAIRFEDCNGGV